ncbi:hypothetical protein K3495_g5039 [Podosphaera aphanis]|nr:hypothetical protein K3495_g5039 [Podosphaera aphanis]
MVEKSVLITGTSEGSIGSALAIEFHRRGLRVFATARNLAKVKHLERLGLEIIPLDVTDSTSILAAVKSVTDRTGGSLDILVNNAGGGFTSPLLDADLTAAKKVFDLNLFAPLAVTQAFIPLLVNAHGLVVNIGSIAGALPYPWQGIYNASKAAVNQLTETLRIELAPLGVRTMLVVTGIIKTNFVANLPTKAVLPTNSFYWPAREEVTEVMQGKEAAVIGMDVEQYAQAVVRNALKRRPTMRLWIGYASKRVFWWHTLASQAILDRLLRNRCLLHKATVKIKEFENLN